MGGYVGEREEERKNVSGYKTHTHTRRGTEDGRGKGSYCDRAIRESCFEEAAIKGRPETSREESRVAIRGEVTSACKGPEAEST